MDTLDGKSDSWLSNRLAQVRTLPSPNDLKHKILIKVKSESTHYTSTQYSDSGSFNSTTSDDNNPGSLLQLQNRKQRQGIIKPLAELGVYISGIKFRNFSLPVSKSVNHIFSLSERVVNQILKDEEKQQQLEKHNNVI